MRFKEFWYMRRSDRRVLWFLLVLLVGVLAIFLITDKVGGDDAADKAFVKAGHNGGYRKDGRGYRYGEGGKSQTFYYNTQERTVHLFPFDPNTADSTDLLALGLSPWQVRNIYRYRAKGGVYRCKEDFGRVYGLTKGQYRELEPYITIGEDYQPYVPADRPDFEHHATHDSLAKKYPVKLKAGEKIELNSADSALLVRVPGIGKYFARQIENRRKWLGGFYSEDQLMEIDDFPKDALNYFYVDTRAVKKINANKATLQELKRHPYINYLQARDILDYRRMRGPLHSIEDLKLTKDFTSEDMERLKHYLEY
jgi:DNA uptake protein ComE-like DNA-binding protein